MDLRDRLARPEILVAPGICDALTANLAARAGFEALYLSGAAVAYTRLGRPDIGLSTATEMAETMALIRDRVDLPVVVDADDGFGNALNVQRTTRMYERAGANALQFEDQASPKRCGHLDGKVLVAVDEMVGKIAAACDARADSGTLVIARTDAIGVDGFEAAIDRAGRYVEAGADVLFVEAPQTGEQLRKIPEVLGQKIPLMANMVEGGKTPPADVRQLEAIGYSLVIFPGGVVRALARCARDYYASLARHGSNEPFRDRMFDFNQLNDVIGTPEMLALGVHYSGEAPVDRDEDDE